MKSEKFFVAGVVLKCLLVVLGRLKPEGYYEFRPVKAREWNLVLKKQKQQQQQQQKEKPLFFMKWHNSGIKFMDLNIERQFLNFLYNFMLGILEDRLR